MHEESNEKALYERIIFLKPTQTKKKTILTLNNLLKALINPICENGFKTLKENLPPSHASYRYQSRGVTGYLIKKLNYMI